MKRLLTTAAQWLAKRGYMTSAEWLRGAEGAATGAVLSDAYLQSIWVHACVQLLAESTANTPFRVSAGANRREAIITDGPAVALFTRPAPGVSAFEFWELLVTWLQLRGNAYVIALDKRGAVVPLGARVRSDAVPATIHVLNSDRVRPYASGGVVSNYVYFPGSEDAGMARAFEPREIIHLRLANPYSAVIGFSPVTLAAVAAGTDYAASRFMQGMMANNADTGLILTTDQMLGEDQQKQVKAALLERKRAAGTADRPAILFGGLRVEKPPVTVADMEFLANRKFARQEICTVYGVPQELLGWTEDANRSVSESARMNFVENKLAPLLARLASGVSPIVSAFNEPRTAGNEPTPWFDVDALPIMAAARRSRVDTGVKLWSIGYSANEVNAALDLGLPTAPHRDVAYLPFSVTPAGADTPPNAAVSSSTASASAPRPLRTSPPSGTGGLSPLWDVLDQQCRTTPQPHQCGAGSAAWWASVRGAVNAKQRKLRAYWFGQRQRVLAALEAQVKIAPAGAIATRGIEDVWNAGSEDELLQGIMRPLLIADLQAGAAQLLAEVGSAEAFAVPPARVAEFLARRVPMIKGINATTWTDLRGSLGEGINAGESYEQLAARVRATYNAAGQLRAEQIAVTETQVAVNSGRYEAMQEVGVARKAWLSSDLETSRPEHVQAERDYRAGIPLDEDFVVDGERLAFPGDPAGSPGNVINCKCTVIALDEDGKTLRLTPSSIAHPQSPAAPPRMAQDERTSRGGIQTAPDTSAHACNGVKSLCKAPAVPTP